MFVELSECRTSLHKNLIKIFDCLNTVAFKTCVLMISVSSDVNGQLSGVTKIEKQCLVILLSISIFE